MALTLLDDDHRAGWLFGYLLLIGLFAFAFASGFGTFEEKSSVGLKEALEIIKSLLSFWAGWKFSRGPFMPPEKPASSSAVQNPPGEPSADSPAKPGDPGERANPQSSN